MALRPSSSDSFGHRARYAPHSSGGTTSRRPQKPTRPSQALRYPLSYVILTISITMKTNLSLLIAVVGISLALFLLFQLIFGEIIALMIWNVTTGIVATLLLSLNFYTVTSTSSNTVRRAASLTGSNLLGIGLFLWTLFFTFFLGDYKDAERGLTTLYIGYLIWLIVCGVIWFVGNRGGAVAEAHNAVVQHHIDDKSDLIHTVKAISQQLSASQPQLHRQLLPTIDLLRSLPHSKASDAGLSTSISALQTAVTANNTEEISMAINELNNHITLLKI